VNSRSGGIFQRFNQTSSTGGGKIGILSKNQWLGKVSGRTLVLVLMVLSLSSGCVPAEEPTPPQLPTETELPEPRHDSDVSIEETLLERRSVRDYTDEPLTLEEVSQLLWAAQGTTGPRGFRTAPSAGALYPLEVYLVVGNVENLAPGVYKYVPEKHELVRVRDGDVREELASGALGQTWVKEGAVDIVIAAVYERTTGKYGDRGVRYVHMEVGHAAQNICLQAAALNLGMVTVGAFYDNRIKDILGMEVNEVPFYVIPVGKKT